jgi:hypothetical protein
MYTELIKDKTEAILEAQKMSKSEESGYAALVWNERMNGYYVMGGGDKIGLQDDKIIGSYRNGKYVI